MKFNERLIKVFDEYNKTVLPVFGNVFYLIIALLFIPLIVVIYSREIPRILLEIMVVCLYVNFIFMVCFAMRLRKFYKEVADVI